MAKGKMPPWVKKGAKGEEAMEEKGESAACEREEHKGGKEKVEKFEKKSFFKKGKGK